MGRGEIHSLDQLRGPMDDILGGLAEQLKELQKYKARYGELKDVTPNGTA
jgi:adenylate cyclase